MWDARRDSSKVYAVSSRTRGVLRRLGRQTGFALRPANGILLWMSRNALTAASVAALALAGTVVGTAGPAQSSHRSYPSGCAPRDVAGLVLRFLDAHNAGATDEADRFLAPATNDDLVEDA